VDLEALYRKAQTAFCIKKAKSESWNFLLKTIDSWGLFYKIMDRLRRSGAALSESLEPEMVERLLDNLFPVGEVHDPGVIWQGWSGFDPA